MTKICKNDCFKLPEVDFTKLFCQAKSCWQKIRHLISPIKLKAKIIRQNSPNLCTFTKCRLTKKGIEFCRRKIGAQMLMQSTPEENIVWGNAKFNLKGRPFRDFEFFSVIFLTRGQYYKNKSKFALNTYTVHYWYETISTEIKLDKVNKFLITFVFFKTNFFSRLAPGRNNRSKGDLQQDLVKSRME